MGLDMYAYSIEQDKVEGHDVSDTLPEDFDFEEQGANTDFAYWRKFNHLHGFMEELYYDKGGEEEFNCEQVRLGLDDLDAIKQALDNNGLKHKQGFFFGDEIIDDEDIEYTYDFIDRAKEAIHNGQSIWYSSWW